MSSFSLNVDPRDAQYARFAGSVLATLRCAVMRRVSEGLSQKEIGDRIDMDKSALSRVLNGRVRNITIKTVSDILWATEHEPVEFHADGFEDLSLDHVPAHLNALNQASSNPVRMRVIGSIAGDGSTAAMHVKRMILTND